MKIIRGSNTPLVLAVSDAQEIKDAKKLSAQLIGFGKVKKEWSKDTVTIQDEFIIFPLTEADTLGLSRGSVKLDIKILGADDVIEFMDVVEYKVIDRENVTVLTEA